MVRNLRLGLFFIIHLYGVAAKEVTNNDVTPISSRTGVYFDSIGKLQLYPIQWKVVSYIDLGPVRDSLQQIKTHQGNLNDYCRRWKNESWYL